MSYAKLAQVGPLSAVPGVTGGCWCLGWGRNTMWPTRMLAMLPPSNAHNYFSACPCPFNPPTTNLLCSAAGCEQGHDHSVRRRLHLPRGAGDQPQGGHRARQVPQHSHAGVRALPARPPGTPRCVCGLPLRLLLCLSGTGALLPARRRRELTAPACHAPLLAPAPCALPVAACSERKNVKLPGVIVDLPTLTEKDVDDLVNWVGGRGSTSVAVQHSVAEGVVAVPRWRCWQPAVVRGWALCDGALRLLTPTRVLPLLDRSLLFLLCPLCAAGRAQRDRPHRRLLCAQGQRPGHRQAGGWLPACLGGPGSGSGSGSGS